MNRQTPTTSIMLTPAFWGILAFALVARALFVLVVSHPELLDGRVHFTRDRVEYHSISATLATTGRYAFAPNSPPTAFRGPGLTIPLAGLYAILGASPFVGLLFALVCGLALVVSIGIAAQTMLRSRQAGLFAMALAAATPSFIQWSAELMSDCLATFCLVACIGLLASWRHTRRPGTLVAAGLLFAWSYYTRASCVFVLPFLLLAAFARPSDGRSAGIFVLTVCAAALPWLARNYGAFGTFLPGTTNTGITVWACNNPVSAGLQAPRVPSEGEGPAIPGEWFLGGYVIYPHIYLPGYAEEFPRDMGELEKDRKGLQLAAGFVCSHRTAFIRLLGYKLWRFVTGRLEGPPSPGAPLAQRVLRVLAASGERWLTLAFGLLGMGCMWARSRPNAYLLGAVLAGTIVFILATRPCPRFFLPGTSALLIAIAYRFFCCRRDGQNER